MTTDEVNRLMQKLQQLEITQATTLAEVVQLRAENAEGKTIHAEHNLRLTKLEQFKYVLMGAALAGTALGASGVAAVFKVAGGA